MRKLDLYLPLPKGEGVVDLQSIQSLSPWERAKTNQLPDGNTGVRVASHA